MKCGESRVGHQNPAELLGSSGTTDPRMPLGSSSHLPLSGCVGVHHAGRVHPGAHRQRLLLHAGRGPPGPEVILNPKHVCDAEASAATRGIKIGGKKSPAERKIFRGQRERRRWRRASPKTWDSIQKHGSRRSNFYSTTLSLLLLENTFFSRTTSVIRGRKWNLENHVGRQEGGRGGGREDRK